VPIITKPIEAPSGLKVTIRKLSYWHVRQAKKAFFSDAIAQGKELGDLADRIAEARKRAEEERRARGEAPLEQPQDAAPEEPWAMYDQQLTLHLGITEWSYADELTNDNIDSMLDEVDADFIFHEIVLYGDRSASEKKGSGEPSVRTLEPVTVPGPSS